MNRPVSVTVVAWIIIALGIEALVGLFSSFVRVALASVIDSSISISVAAEIGALFQVAIIVFAAFMLKGANWARIAYVVLAILIILALIPQVLRHATLTLTFIWTIARTAVFCFFLFRADANTYFDRGRSSVIHDAGEGEPLPRSIAWHV